MGPSLLARILPCFVLFFTGCGLPVSHIVRKKGPRPTMETNQTFHSVLQKFDAEASKRRGGMITTQSVAVVFGFPQHPKHVADCTIYENGLMAITVKENWWRQNPPSSQESLIFHELGHCLLGREEHDCTMMPDGTKKSLMHAEVVHGTHYMAHRERYLNELFNAPSHSPSASCN